MRTLIVATQVRLPGRHGGTTHVGELQRSLERFGPVRVLAQRGSTAPGVTGVAWPWRGHPLLARMTALAAFPHALREARSFGPDVIYERASSYGLGAMLSRALDVPMLCMVLDEHYARRSLVRARRIVSTTASTVPAAFRSKYVKVSWGANAEVFHPDVPPVDPSRLPSFSGTTIGYVGSFKRWHGLEDLVTAATRTRHLPVRFLLVGDGPLREGLERQAEAQGVAEHFVFAGSVDYDEVPRWIAAMDVCVAPFRPSGHQASNGEFVLDPLKVFEYLAMGKPTITADTANIRSLIEDRTHARLVPPGDVDALVAAIEAILESPADAAQMASQGRALVLERHTWAAHAAHLHQLFEEMRAR